MLQETKELIAYSKKRKFTPKSPVPIVTQVSPPNPAPTAPPQVVPPAPKQSTRYPTLGDDPLRFVFNFHLSENSRKATRMIREGLKLLDPLPVDLSRGNIEYLKQELKSLKTIMNNVEEQLYPNMK